MCQLDELKKHRDEIYKIARKNKAKKLYVFGSCARKEETPESDVDFLVEFQDASLLDHIGLKLDLSAYLNRSVDVVSLNALKNELFDRNVRRDMVPL